MRRLFLAAALMLVAATPAFAHTDNDRVAFGSDITVPEGESVGDIACAFCTVKVHGQVKGDVAVLFGRIAVDDNQGISGDVAALGTDLHLGEESTIGGNLALVGGDMNMASSATVHGDRTVMPGRVWLLLPLAPLLILVGMIWLIVWIVRRNRYQFPVYPNGRGL